MQPEISEFSYGYALTSELINLFGLKPAGAPEFATQLAEGKPGGGWDVKLPGIPIYLQFKRADRMIAGHAKESSKFSSLPYFRMHVHRRDLSDQHRHLLDLESAGNIVRYAAPAFSFSKELHHYYSTDQVAQNSLFLSPSEIGPLPDDKGHYVSFSPSPSVAYFCTEPRVIRADTAESLFGAIAESHLEQRGRPVDSQFFEQIAMELINIYEGRMRSNEEIDVMRTVRALAGRREPHDFAQLIVRTLFDAELVIYSERRASLIRDRKRVAIQERHADVKVGGIGYTSRRFARRNA